MVNLRNIANQVTRAINPNVTCERWRSTGYTTADTGKRTPTYDKTAIVIQLQAMADEDLKQLESLNIQGVHRKVYCNPQVLAMVRVAEKGGDLLVFAPGKLPEGNTWLCTHVLERWPDWCTFSITLQNETLTPTTL